MVQFRISIYWKIFLTILASMVLSALLIGSLYLGFDPRTKIHQQIQKSLLLKTNSTADRITSRIKTSSQPLEEILREIHAQEKDIAPAAMAQIHANWRGFPQNREEAIRRFWCKQLRVNPQRVIGRMTDAKHPLIAPN